MMLPSSLYSPARLKSAFRSIPPFSLCGGPLGAAYVTGAIYLVQLVGFAVIPYHQTS